MMNLESTRRQLQQIHARGRTNAEGWDILAGWVMEREAAKAEDVEATGGETQATICTFADETFGPASSNIRVAARANEEMAELLRALSADDNHPKAAEEIADVVIILYRLARNLGTDLRAEIDRKMAINRKRTWQRDSTGHGYHVREKVAAQ